MATVTERPPSEHAESVYSNFDHELDEAVADALLRDESLYAQHAAWNFCGYVWHADGRWHEQVWRFNSPVETRSGDDLASLIADVNADYGSD